MTSLSYRVVLGLGLAAAAGTGNSQQGARDPLAPLPPTTAAIQAPSLVLPPRIAPASLRERVTALGRAFNGSAGISVVSLSDGWQADYNATTLFPQQSCSKLWVAITAMDAVDRGRISLNDKVTQMEAAGRTIHERRAVLEAAAARNDKDTAGHEASALVVARTRVDQLSAEANQCIGQELSFMSAQVSASMRRWPGCSASRAAVPPT